MILIINNQTRNRHYSARIRVDEHFAYGESEMLTGSVYDQILYIHTMYIIHNMYYFMLCSCLAACR